jgi:predicted ATPase
MIERASSGSRSSINSVEPLISANSAVTVLRSPSIASDAAPSATTRICDLGEETVVEAAAFVGPIAVPHFLQNRAPGRHALELAREGHGQIVAAMGEAGVGKSRLFFEFKAVSEIGCLVLEAYSVSHGKASAYVPVIELLRGYFHIAAEDDEPCRREKIAGKVLMLERSLEDTLPYIFTLIGVQEGSDPFAQMDPQVRRGRTQEAIKRVLLRESLNQPLIVIFEDLHWIDSETRAFLSCMVDAIANARILLLVNYRPEYRHDWGSRTYYTQLRLDPLGRESAGDAGRIARR